VRRHNSVNHSIPQRNIPNIDVGWIAHDRLRVRLREPSASRSRACAREHQSVLV